VADWRQADETHFKTVVKSTRNQKIVEVEPKKEQLHPNPTSNKSGKKVSNEIWTEEEISLPPPVAEGDTRKRPDYDIVYRQHVSPEDHYINLNMRDPSTAFCDDLIVKIRLPGTIDASRIALRLKKGSLHLETRD